MSIDLGSTGEVKVTRKGGFIGTIFIEPTGFRFVTHHLKSVRTGKCEYPEQKEVKVVLDDDVMKGE